MQAFQHLVLLIGTNPLPPFVVASFFLSCAQQEDWDLQHVWLLYSETGPQQTSTAQQAQQVSLALSGRFEIQVHLHPIRNISSAPCIQADVQALSAQLGSDSVHLNYSGGTKAMSLHTYRALEQQHGERLRCSYLDGRRFQIINDHSGQPWHQQDLRALVQIHFNELIALHDFELYRPYVATLEPEWLGALEAFNRLLHQEQFKNFWSPLESRDGWRYLRDPLMKAASGVQDISRQKYSKLFRRNLRKGQPEIDARRHQFMPNAAFQSIIQSLPLAWQDLLSRPQLHELPEPELTILFQLIRFLDGQWLELHTFRALEAALTEQNLRADLCMGLELKQKHWDTYFEVDIAALIGYQLLGISCTTYDLKSACKNKGFEIIHRIRQIGGDEIREALKMMLVTCVKAVEQERLQQELAVATGTGKANILVCGQADLPLETLQTRIREFLTY